MVGASLDVLRSACPAQYVTFLFPVIDANNQRAEIDARCAARAPDPPPARNPSTPPAPHTDPAHLPAALHRPRATWHASLASHPLFAPVCAGAQFCPLTSTMVEGGLARRRGGGGAAHGRGRARGEHRAIDVTPDLVEAWHACARCGVARDPRAHIWRPAERGAGSAREAVHSSMSYTPGQSPRYTWGREAQRAQQ